MNRDLRDELLASAGAEADRLRGVIGALEGRAARAEAEREVVAGWPPERVEAARRALRDPRFADAEGFAAELAAARAELGALQDLRRRLST